MIALIAVLALLVAPLPELNIEAPRELSYAEERLRPASRDHLADVASVIGVPNSGPPVRIVLATESSEWARRVPPWTAGFAVGGDLVVLFPTRSPIYPHGTLEDVLRHELAHVLIARASGGTQVPRWFNEGLAMAAERSWGLGDRARLAWELAFGPRLTLRDVDRLFEGDRNDQTRAYAVAGWFVADLLNASGRHVPRDVLALVASGLPFEQAFAQGTGMTLVSAEGEFWERQRTWTTWLPVATSTTALWIAIALLAVYAARRRRQRRAALHRRWADDEARERAGEAADGEEPPAS